MDKIIGIMLVVAAVLSVYLSFMDPTRLYIG